MQVERRGRPRRDDVQRSGHDASADPPRVRGSRQPVQLDTLAASTHPPMIRDIRHVASRMALQIGLEGATMSDDTTKAAVDGKLVRLAEGHEVREWCKSLGCTEAQLRESVQAVGNAPENVREFLKTLTRRGVF